MAIVSWPYNRFCDVISPYIAGPIPSVFSALIVHSELKSVHPGFRVAFIFYARVNYQIMLFSTCLL